MYKEREGVLSVSEANAKGVSWLVAEASAGRTHVVQRHGKPTAAVVSVSELARLERMDEAAKDLLLWSLSLARLTTDTGVRHDLDDVARELGIDPEELEED